MGVLHCVGEYVGVGKGRTYDFNSQVFRMEEAIPGKPQLHLDMIFIKLLKYSFCTIQPYPFKM